MIFFVLLISIGHIYENVVQNRFVYTSLIKVEWWKIILKYNFDFIYTFRQCYLKWDINNFIWKVIIKIDLFYKNSMNKIKWIK